MSKQIFKEKIAQTVDILKEKDIDMWLTFVRESSINHDAAMDMVVGNNSTWEAAFIINKDGDTTAIVGDMEEENFVKAGLYKNITGYLKSIREPLQEYLKKKNPEKIAINFSKTSVLADGLTHGMFLKLLDHLKGTGFENKLTGAEEIISALRGRKSVTELSIMKEAVDETLKIFDEATNFIRPGVSEIEVAEHIKKITFDKGFELGWEETHCPAVFAGPNPSGPHMGPSDKKIQKGTLVNMDFMDAIARNYIIENGYPEYAHGLGHQVGKTVHDGVAGLFPSWERYGNAPFMELEENQVFTIEPRLPVEGYGVSTLEEEVYLTKEGCEFISTPQLGLILINTK
ncbi:MAG: M24 family metallopeptidase [Ignavibacteriaceae bacterium]